MNVIGKKLVTTLEDILMSELLVNHQFFYKPDEVAQILRISPSQVYTLCREGVIPALYIGRNLRIPNEDFNRWLRSQFPGNFSDEKY
jgi:excisionase family DNA binding protein